MLEYSQLIMLAALQVLKVRNFTADIRYIKLKHNANECNEEKTNKYMCKMRKLNLNVT